MMKKYILPVFFLLLPVFVSAQKLSPIEAIDKGSERKIRSFEKIILQGNGNIFLLKGEEYRLKLEGENEEFVVVINSGKSLIIRPADEDEDKKFNIYVQAPAYNQVKILGNGDVVTHSPDNITTDIQINGQGNIIKKELQELQDLNPNEDLNVRKSEE